MTTQPLYPPESWDEAYDRIAEELGWALEGVRSDETAKSWIEQAVKQINAAEAAIPEFYPGEFCDRLRRAAASVASTEESSLECDFEDIKASYGDAATDLNRRLQVAREAGDRDVEHAIWKEGEHLQSEAQVSVDARVERARIDILRLRTLMDLGAALGLTPP